MSSVKRRAAGKEEGMDNNALESDLSSPNSRLTVLINAVNRMSRNPAIDLSLSKILDEFLEKVEESARYLEHGIFNINFAEAALLLQSSTDLYSKKVDLLWDIIYDYQKRMILTEGRGDSNNHEIEKLEERKRKYKRRKKLSKADDQTKSLVEEFSWGASDNVDYLNQTYETTNLVADWEKFRVEPCRDNPLLDKPNQNFFIPNTSVFSEDNDYIARYDQFHSFNAISDIFHLEQLKLLPDEQGCVTRMRIDSYVINEFLYEKQIPADTPRENYVEELGQYIKRFIEMKQQHEQGCERLSNLGLTETSLRRCSAADSGMDEDRFSSISGHCPSPKTAKSKNCDIASEIEGKTDINAPKEARSKSCSQDSAFFEMEAEYDTERCAELCRRTTEHNSIAIAEVLEEEVPLIVDPTDKENNNNVIKRLKESEITNTQLCCGSTIIVTRQKEPKRWDVLLEHDLKEGQKKQKNVRKRRISEKMLLKLSTGLTVNVIDFENFVRRQYRSSEGEGQVPGVLSEPESSDSDDDNDNTTLDIVQEPLAEITEIVEVEPPDPTPDIDDLQISNLVQPVSLAIHGLNLSKEPDLPTRAPSTSIQDSLLLEQSRKNVRDWRLYIIPKLKEMENKSDFDIHEYGSRIIGPSAIGEKRYFKDIVKGEGAVEVTKYFIAALQLANTNNVEVEGAIPGEIANDTFTLLTRHKTRHHESLDEYKAPSEETFRERLQKAQASNPKTALFSTPHGMPPKKKIKKDKSPKILF